MRKLIIILSCTMLIVSSFLLYRSIKLENQYYTPPAEADYSDLEFKDLESRKKALKYYSYEERKEIFEKTYGNSLYIELFRCLPRSINELSLINNQINYMSNSANRNPWPMGKNFTDEQQKMFENVKNEIFDFPCNCHIPNSYFVEIFSIYNMRYGLSIDLFEKLEKAIPIEILLEKYIDICIGSSCTGSHMDSSHLQNYIRKIIVDKLPIFIKILNKKTDDEVKSFWYFIFKSYEYHKTDEKDSRGHTIRYGKEKNEADYKNLHAKLLETHPRLAQDLEEAWNKIIDNA